MNLSGRTALITGAGQGIGQACAEVFADRGADLVLMDKNSRTLPRVAAQIAEKGGHVKTVIIDLTHHRKLHKIIDEIKAQTHIDILVNNAGFDRPGTTMKIGKEQFNAVLGIHVGVPFLLIKSFLQEMRDARWGRVINISSIYGIQGAKGEAAYSTAKAAVIGLTKTAAREAGKDGVTVYKAPIIDQTLLGRMGEPEEVAKVAAFLASDDSSFITGSTITVSGGWGI
ncbi:MAG: fabG2 [Deltaproteobacteria bacterium]|nr:fabG2 [Deltaproteobacteria bacterium]